MSIDFDDSTMGTSPKPTIDPGLNYFFKLVLIPDLFACFKQTTDGTIGTDGTTGTDGTMGLILREMVLDGETEKLVVKETIKPLDKFTLDQLKKIAPKIGLVRQKNKGDFITNITKLVLSKSNAVNNTTERKIQQQQRLWNNSIIVMRFIGILFHVDYSNASANLNDTKKRKDFENGAGLNNKRFFKSIAEIVNDDESQYHTSILQPPTFEEFSVNLYDGHLGMIDDEEQPSFPLRDQVLWSELKTINGLLHKTYRGMKYNMSVSGNHDSDAFNYTGEALGKCVAGHKITAANMYYFYMQMSFNSKLCIANQVTLPQSLQNTSSNIGEWESKTKTTKTDRKKGKKVSSTDKDDPLNALILAMTTQFDNKVQHEVKTQVYNCTEKMRSDVQKSAKYQTVINTQ